MLEIERKFLIDGKLLHIPPNSKIEYITQWYNADDSPESGRCERIRKSMDVKTCNCTYTHTTKERISDTTRHEDEIELSLDQFNALLNRGNQWYRLEKLRCTFTTNGNSRPWEVDVFQHDNDGLCIAEMELLDPNDEIIFPEWISTEITSDMRYTNVQLARVPHTKF